MYTIWELIPFFLLLTTVVLVMVPSQILAEKWLRLSLTATMVAAILTGTLDAIGVLALFSAGVLLVLSMQSKKIPWLFGLLFITMSVAITLHKAPGFHNLLIFDHVKLSPDAKPFTMYLNFDKVCLGVIIAIFFLRQKQIFFTYTMQIFIKSTLKYWLGASILLSVLSLLLGYVRFDLKWPGGALIWALNNLFFVCFAEEVFFRGLILGFLQKRMSPSKYANHFAILISSLAFGIAHFAGGWQYILLASIAGLFYGGAALATGHIASSILVHFGLNLVHFVFLSYPALNL